MRIVLDTNVYIAAFLSKGLASKILLLGEKGRVSLYISPDIFKEIQDKLATKFKVGKKDIEEFSYLVRNSTKPIYPKKKINFVKIDPDDNIVLECASSANANLIVSMDKHLLKLKSFERIGIVHPKTLTWILPKLL